MNAALQDLGLKIAHIGINTSDEEEYARTVATLSLLLGVAVEETPVSSMVGTQAEVMKPGSRGRNGHIAIHADSLPEAETFFLEHGFSIDESSRRRFEDGRTHLVYLNEDIAGFDIHLTCD